MKPEQLLRAILPSVIVDNFDIDRFEKTDTRFDIWLDEKKVQMRRDKKNRCIALWIGEYHNIQDYPIVAGRHGCMYSSANAGQDNRRDIQFTTGTCRNTTARSSTGGSLFF